MERLFEFIIKQIVTLAIKVMFDFLLYQIKKCVSANTHQQK